MTPASERTAALSPSLLLEGLGCPGATARPTRRRKASAGSGRHVTGTAAGRQDRSHGTGADVDTSMDMDMDTDAFAAVNGS